MLKKLIWVALTTVLVFSIIALSSGVSSADTGTEGLNINEIQKEFETNIEKDLELKSGEELKELEKFYRQYNNLSNDEQQLFIEYISSEETMESIFDVSSEMHLNSRNISSVTTEKEDSSNSDLPEGVEVRTSVGTSPDSTSEIELSNDYGTTATQRRVAWYERYVEILGVQMINHRSEVRFKRTGYGGTIFETYAHDHFEKRNWSVASYNTSGEYRDHTSTTAYSGANVQMHLVSKYVPILGPIRSGQAYVESDNKGNVTGYFKGYD